MIETIKNILSKLGLFNIVRTMVKKPFNSIRSYFFRKNVLKTFQKLLSILEEEKIEAFLVFGTLLGAIREKGFIKHDLDLDFGVWEDNDFLKLRECLEAKGFYLKSEIILLFRFYFSFIKKSTICSGTLLSPPKTIISSIFSLLV